MKYKYFVSYHFLTNRTNGFGNTILRITEKIKSSEVIRQIEEELTATQDGFNNVVIINWKYLGRER